MTNNNYVYSRLELDPGSGPTTTNRRRLLVNLLIGLVLIFGLGGLFVHISQRTTNDAEITTTGSRKCNTCLYIAAEPFDSLTEINLLSKHVLAHFSYALHHRYL